MNTTQYQPLFDQALKAVTSPYEIPLNYIGVYAGRSAYQTSKGLVLKGNIQPSKLELLMEAD